MRLAIAQGKCTQVLKKNFIETKVNDFGKLSHISFNFSLKQFTNLIFDFFLRKIESEAEIFA